MAIEIVVSTEDEDLKAFKWGVASSLYHGRCHRGRVLYVHRIVMERILRRPMRRGECVDHINGNPTDNRRSNIRLANKKFNAANSMKQRNTTSKFKGVYEQRRKPGTFTAQVTHMGTKIHLGVFVSEKQAALAYDEAARKCHGDFARVNFPHPGERGAV